MQIHDGNNGPLKYGSVVVPLNNSSMDFEHMKNIQHILLLSLIHTVDSVNQQFMCSMPMGQFLAKNGVHYITFEGVPAQ